MTSPSTAAPPPDAKLARRVVLGLHRRMTAALNAATDAALEEWLSGAPAESAPPPPPVEGPGLVEAARDQNAGADFDRGVYVAAKLAVDMSTGYAGDDPRSRALMDFVECLFQYYPGGKRARDSEEARRKSHVEKLKDVRRELAYYARNDMGERMTGVESALEDVDALIAELGSAP